MDSVVGSELRELHVSPFVLTPAARLQVNAESLCFVDLERWSLKGARLAFSPGAGFGNAGGIS